MTPPSLKPVRNAPAACFAVAVITDLALELSNSGTVAGLGTAEARCAELSVGASSLISAPERRGWQRGMIVLLSLGPERGVWTLERSGASAQQAMALAEEGVANLMGASRRPRLKNAIFKVAAGTGPREGQRQLSQPGTLTQSCKKRITMDIEIIRKHHRSKSNAQIYEEERCHKSIIWEK
ncbi:hypothetical protein CYMTET_28351 [Cymbomonas tetramitiformis]|uniref:Uncharacterized protein n=1 Tax=Cymbomonas tetramitiformis TaxID=36881 RepID=A0AAE0FNJ1_9CHLO|nr:hypothetical protein CYMTET_28351 [Cymbomonas tetramitiformis]